MFNGSLSQCLPIIHLLAVAPFCAYHRVTEIGFVKDAMFTSVEKKIAGSLYHYAANHFFLSRLHYNTVFARILFCVCIHVSMLFVIVCVHKNSH